MPDTAPLKVVVIASSFPAINQPWINTHFSQLEEQGVDFRIVHSTRADSEERKQAAGSFLPKCTYISRDPRDWLRSFLAILTRHPLRELLAMGSTFSRTAAYRLPLRDRLKIMLIPCTSGMSSVPAQSQMLYTSISTKMSWGSGLGSRLRVHHC